MKLSEMAPNLTPEQLAKCEIKIRVNWERKNLKIAIVDENNGLVAIKELDTNSEKTEPPNTSTQGDYWKVHHNAWLD